MATRIPLVLAAGQIQQLQNADSISGNVKNGSALLDFGVFPGASDASVAVTGQAAIQAGSTIDAWLSPAATTDHTADEHLVESLSVFCGNVIAGTGFTIYGTNTSQLYDANGNGTLVYGKWNIFWRWS